MEKNYFSGIVGGILGGIIFSIPWILVYVFGNMLLSALALIIGIGILKGYQLFKGKVTKSLPAIIFVIAIIIVLFETLFVIPMVELAKEGYPANLEMLRWVYTIPDFTSGLFKDLAFSLLFTVLGVSSVTSSVKRQLNGDENQTIKYGGEKEATSTKQQMVKDFFLNNNATSWENSIVVDYSSGLDQNTFLYLQNVGVVKAFNGSYYYSLEDERRLEEEQAAAAKKRVKTTIITVCVTLVVILALVVGVAIFSDSNGSSNLTPTTVEVTSKHSFVLNENYSYEEDDEEEYGYYVYLTEDEDLKEGYIAIAYYDDGDYYIDEDSVDSFAAIFEDYTDVTISSKSLKSTGTGLPMVEIVLDVEGSDDDGPYKYVELIDIIVTDDTNMFYLDTLADNLKKANKLLDGSDILNTIK